MSKFSENALIILILPAMWLLSFTKVHATSLPVLSFWLTMIVIFALFSGVLVWWVA